MNKPVIPAGTAASQNQQIKQHLEKGCSITQLEAYRRYGCLRLSGRIYDLNHSGMNIRSEMVTIGNKRVARYSLNNN